MAFIQRYVDAQNGDDSNQGLFVDPWKSLSKADTFLVANPSDVIITLAGRFQVGENLVVTGLTNILIEQWAGKDQAEIRGDVLVTGWTASGPSGEFEAAGPTTVPASVVWNWDTNTTRDGRHFGHLVPGTFDSLAGGEWGYDAASDVLQVRLPSEATQAGADGDPDLLTSIAYTIAGSGVTLTGTGNTLDGIRGYLWVEDGKYCLDLIAGNDLLIKNCIGIDGGFHVLGIHGNSNTNLRIDNCVARGCRQGGGTTMVIYGEGATVTGGSADCEISMGGLLTKDATTVLTTGTSVNNCPGFITHTNNIGVITNLEIHRMVFVGNPQAAGAALSANSLTAAETDADDGETYPVRYYDCVGMDLAKAVSTNSLSSAITRCAFFRCKFEGDLDYAGGNNTVIFANGGDVKLYLESCEIIWDLGTANTRQIFRIFTDAFITLVNCSVYMFDGPGGLNAMFRYQDGTGIKARQCVFFMDASGEDRVFCVGDSAVAAGAHDFEDCWYDNVDTDDYSDNTSFNSEAEWTSVIDANGIYEVLPGYTSAIDLSPAFGSELLDRTKTLTWGTSRMGINDRPYSGYYGAYQFDSIPVRLLLLY